MILPFLCSGDWRLHWFMVFSLRFLTTEPTTAAGSELKFLPIVFSLRPELARKIKAVLAATLSRGVQVSRCRLHAGSGCCFVYVLSPFDPDPPRYCTVMW